MPAQHLPADCAIERLVEQQQASFVSSEYGCGPGALRRCLVEEADVICCTLAGAGCAALLDVALASPAFRVDALVGNAGILGPITPLHHVDPKPWDDVMAVNVTANWRLIRSLDPLLRRSPEGRVVFLTSAAASRAELRAYWGPYAASKAALDALARTYAAETVNTSQIRVMLVNPGPLRTRMRASAMPGVK